MFLPFLVAGLILVLAGGSWFTGAVTVGTILLVICAVILVIQVAAGVLAVKAVKTVNKHSRDLGRW